MRQSIVWLLHSSRLLGRNPRPFDTRRSPLTRAASSKLSRCKLESMRPCLSGSGLVLRNSLESMRPCRDDKGRTLRPFDNRTRPHAFQTASRRSPDISPVSEPCTPPRRQRPGRARLETASTPGGPMCGQRRAAPRPIPDSTRLHKIKVQAASPLLLPALFPASAICCFHTSGGDVLRHLRQLPAPSG